MGDNTMAMRFPAGQTMLDSALRREGIRRDQVDIQLMYYSASWALQVKCPSVGYRRVQQLAPDDLRADTSFKELCESIAQELSVKLRRAAATS